MGTAGYVRSFEDFGIDDVPLVGGKNASLGEMLQKLSRQGVRVPHGFAVTAAAYRHMLDEAGAWDRLHAELDDIDPADVAALARKAKRAREIVYGAGLPDDLAAAILEGYRALQREYGEEVSLAVRSSATAEDLPTASFAGQQDSYLNIKGEQSLLDTCRRCFASLFTDRAIHYRIDQGFDHFKVSLSIGVMKMVRSDIASSGVMFSLDTESGFRDAVFITGAYGLGENVVQGAVDPDEFYVHKPTYLAGHRTVLRRLLGDKAVKMILVDGETKNTTRNIPTPKADRDPVLPHRCRRPRAGRLRVHHRGALRQTDGHGVGEGRSRRSALHRAGPPRDGGLPAQRDGAGNVRARGQGRDPHRGPLGR